VKVKELEKATSYLLLLARSALEDQREAWKSGAVKEEIEMASL
jgi:hypothetical protein